MGYIYTYTEHQLKTLLAARTKPNTLERLIYSVSKVERYAIMKVVGISGYSHFGKYVELEEIVMGKRYKWFLTKDTPLPVDAQMGDTLFNVALIKADSELTIAYAFCENIEMYSSIETHQPTRTKMMKMEDMPDIDYENDYGRSTSEYGGIHGLSDDVINDAFEGDPDNYWNID